ncbi:hypothetical protein [Streptomyces sp. NPDC088135]|uniref:hypothetical protein n=1 Tax=Streptomyces sp. NPDC088135 TaxID=3160993 RepID=UPI003440C19D
MRDLIVRTLELISALFGNKPGRHSAAHLNAPAAPSPAPTPAAPLPPHIQERNRRLDGEDVELIRPYYAAYLRNQDAETVRLKAVRKRQRELFWATMGMDYPGVQLHGAGASA